MVRARSRLVHYSPRVSSPHLADAYSMKTFAQFPRWRDRKSDRKCGKVMQYLADRHTGLFPLGQPVVRRPRRALRVPRPVRDPVKLINVYGYGFCGILGPTMAGICQDMGIGPARTLILPGWDHVVGETYYDGKWHYLDLDVRAAFRRPDGRLASMADGSDGRPPLEAGPTARCSSRSTRWTAVQQVYREDARALHYGHQLQRPHDGLRAPPGRDLHARWKPQGRPLEPHRAHHEGRLLPQADRARACAAPSASTPAGRSTPTATAGSSTSPT